MRPGFGGATTGVRAETPGTFGLNTLIVSAHDFRTPRRANMHFIAAELARHGKVRFFSAGLSTLSMLKGDIRTPLRRAANRVVVSEGVECYLWRRIWHPWKLPGPGPGWCESALYSRYLAAAPDVLREWAREADIIIVESGLGVLFARWLRDVNPSAKLIYNASDDLATVGCSQTLQRILAADFEVFDLARVPSKLLARRLPGTAPIIVVPHGTEPPAEGNEPSPFTTARNAVSVGSMLFDPNFFRVAAAHFPDVTFHIIGGGKLAQQVHLPNVAHYDEMPFARTQTYIRHATLGIAAYRRGTFADYLVDSSRKLRQYGEFGIPAVCPGYAAGDWAGRHGYEPGDPASIIAAVDAALAAGPGEKQSFPSWAAVVQRLLAPLDPPFPARDPAAEADRLLA